jgi:H+/Cl- antiporter ClcA
MDNKSGAILKKYLPLLIGVLLGAVGGYLYYRFVGCVSGTCPISSNPVISTLYGGVIGALLGLALTPGKSRPRKDEDEERHG